MAGPSPALANNDDASTCGPSAARVAANAIGPVDLEHLAWNPVGRLYERHGFVVASRNDSHMPRVRWPQPSAAIVDDTIRGWLRRDDPVVPLPSRPSP